MVNNDGSDPSPVDPWLNITAGKGPDPKGLKITTSSSTAMPFSTKAVVARSSSRIAYVVHAAPSHALAVSQRPRNVTESRVTAPSARTTSTKSPGSVTVAVPEGCSARISPFNNSCGALALFVLQLIEPSHDACPAGHRATHKIQVAAGNGRRTRTTATPTRACGQDCHKAKTTTPITREDVTSTHTFFQRAPPTLLTGLSINPA